MATVDMGRLRTVLAAYPDERLLRIVGEDQAEYAAEAIAFAREELVSRGIAPSVPAPPAPTSEAPPAAARYASARERCFLVLPDVFCHSDAFPALANLLGDVFLVAEGFYFIPYAQPGEDPLPGEAMAKCLRAAASARRRDWGKDVGELPALHPQSVFVPRRELMQVSFIPTPRGTQAHAPDELILHVLGGAALHIHRRSSRHSAAAPFLTLREPLLAYARRQDVFHPTRFCSAGGKGYPTPQACFNSLAAGGAGASAEMLAMMAADDDWMEWFVDRFAGAWPQRQAAAIQAIRRMPQPFVTQFRERLGRRAASREDLLYGYGIAGTGLVGIGVFAAGFAAGEFGWGAVLAAGVVGALMLAGGTWMVREQRTLGRYAAELEPGGPAAPGADPARASERRVRAAHRSRWAAKAKPWITGGLAAGGIAAVGFWALPPAPPAGQSGTGELLLRLILLALAFWSGISLLKGVEIAFTGRSTPANLAYYACPHCRQALSQAWLPDAGQAMRCPRCGCTVQT